MTHHKMTARICAISQISLLSLFIWGVVSTSPSARAEVSLKREQGRVYLHNQSDFDLLDVSWGQRTRDRLIAGDTWGVEELPTLDIFDEELPLQLYGHIDYSQWGVALDELPGSKLWARLQLSTAGFNIHRGSKISRIGSETRRIHALMNLAQLNPQVGRAWVTTGRESQLKLALLAYAARFAPPQSLLEPLLERVSLKPELALRGAPRALGWPEGYESLPSIRDSLRQALALHGTSALSVLLKHPAWAKDRGIDNPLLAFAELPYEEVIEALKARGELQSVTQLLQRFEAEDELARTRAQEGLLVARDALNKLMQARAEGDVKRALDYVISITLMWRRNNLKPQHSQTSWIMCNYLNSAAQEASNEKRLIAAHSYLSLGRDVCFGHMFYRAAVSEFMRTRGDLASFDLRLSDALHWYRAAVWSDGSVIDRVRLIDTLSQLAVNEISQNHIAQAQSYLKEARTIETPKVPIRKMLVVAGQLIPIPDQRGQLALIFLACLLGIGALSAIMRVVFSRKG